MKRVKMQKKIFFTPLRTSRVAQSASVEAQPYLPHVTCSVPSSVHAKFHADRTKTVGAKGIHTDRQTDRQTDRGILIIILITSISLVNVFDCFNCHDSHIAYFVILFFSP